jgi:type IX secretion system PorP/SprF family membrane protein
MKKMKWPIKLLLLLLLLPCAASAQSDQHYTMFMYNKLLYNPAYAGSREATSINALYRNQWTGIDKAPVTFNISADGLLGSYMKPFRKVAVGGSINNESQGIENNTNIRAYYAYRLQLKKSILSFGLSGGGSLYSARYSELHPQNPTPDPNLANDVRNSFLPNFGFGVYWSADNYYVSFGIPGLLQNHYDRKGPNINNVRARQVRGYYLSGGYVYKASSIIKLQPQLLMRYAGNTDYKLPFSADINLSAIAYDRAMLGFSYRTDKSFEAILHVQATDKINIGYAYDYMMSALNGYSGGSHEIVVGYDFVREHSKYANPRFLKTF